MKLTKLIKLPDVTEQQGVIKVNSQLGENTDTKCEIARWCKQHEKTTSVNLCSKVIIFSGGKIRFEQLFWTSNSLEEKGFIQL